MRGRRRFNESGQPTMW